MRNVWYSMLALAIVSFAPTVAADDPQYTIPNPGDPDGPLAAAADAFTAISEDEATSFSGSVSTNADEAQGSALDLSPPASNGVMIVENATVFGSGVVGHARVVATTSIAWGSGEVTAKQDQANATLTAADSVGGAAVGAGQTIVNAAQDAACSSPLQSGGAPTPCTEESIVAAVGAALLDVQGHTPSPDMNDTLNAVIAALQGIIGN